MAPPREPQTAGDPAPPSSFADGSPQSRDALRAVPLRSASRPSLLAARIESLRGAGPKLAAVAGEMGLNTVGDVLLHIPHSYRDRATPRKLAELRIGEEATVEVQVRSARVRPTRRRGLVIVEASVADDSGPAKAVWFNQAWLVDRLTEGTRLLLFGKLDRSGFRVEAHEVIGGGGDQASAGIHTTGIVPVHPASERLRTQRLREWAWQVRPFARHAIEPLPAELRARRGLALAGDALLAAHFPDTLPEAEEARRPWLSRSSSCIRWPWGHGARRAARPAPGFHSTRTGSSSSRGSSRCRSSSRAISAGPWARSTPISGPIARCSVC